MKYYSTLSDQSVIVIREMPTLSLIPHISGINLHQPECS